VASCVPLLICTEKILGLRQPCVSPALHIVHCRLDYRLTDTLSCVGRPPGTLSYGHQAHVQSLPWLTNEGRGACSDSGVCWAIDNAGSHHQQKCPNLVRFGKVRTISHGQATPAKTLDHLMSRLLILTSQGLPRVFQPHGHLERHCETGAI
jgi:hypothetical protein